MHTRFPVSTTQPLGSTSPMSGNPRARRLEGRGTLHMRFPNPAQLRTTLQKLPASMWSISRQDDVLSIQTHDAGLMVLIESLSGALSPADQADVRVVFEPIGKQLEFSDYFESDSLFGLISRMQSDWLLDMIYEDRLTSVFQPIVSARDAGILGYECLVRGMEDGHLVGGSRILQVAGGSGLLSQTDYAARSKAIREASRYGIRSKIFINFTPSAVYDQIHSLHDTVELLDEMGLDRKQIVFEVIESERMVDVRHLERILRYYRELDFQVALDDVGSGYASLNVMQELRPDYSKLDAQLIRNVDRDSYKSVLTAKLLEASHELGVKSIAEGVETEGECQWLREHGADYLQGFYFAYPSSPPPTM